MIMGLVYILGMCLAALISYKEIREAREKSKDWEHLAGYWQKQYWTEFRKHNDDERFNITSIVPEYENQR